MSSTSLFKFQNVHFAKILLTSPATNCSTGHKFCSFVVLETVLCFPPAAKECVIAYSNSLDMLYFWWHLKSCSNWQLDKRLIKKHYSKVDEPQPADKINIKGKSCVFVLETEKLVWGDGRNLVSSVPCFFVAVKWVFRFFHAWSAFQ